MATISAKRYEVKFYPRSEGGEGGTAEYVFTLADSPMFEYGNQTIVYLEEVGRPDLDTCIDTRYDMSIKRDGSNFDEWCREVIKDRYIPAEYIREIV